MNDDLILRSALLEAMPKNDELLSYEVRRVICNAPAVDAVPMDFHERCLGLEVRRRFNAEETARQCIENYEPVRHGRWIKEEDRTNHWHCSECGLVEGMVHYTMNYCPKCGAKMDGKECVPRKCGSCSNDGWDMPQCRECNEANDFKWYKCKMNAEVEG